MGLARLVEGCHQRLVFDQSVGLLELWRVMTGVWFGEFLGDVEESREEDIARRDVVDGGGCSGGRGVAAAIDVEEADEEI